MSLRIKFEVILATVLVLGVALSIAYERFVVIPQFAAVERENAIDGMTRSVAFLRDRIEDLDRHGREWAKRAESGGSSDKADPGALEGASASIRIGEIEFAAVLDDESRPILLLGDVFHRGENGTGSSDRRKAEKFGSTIVGALAKRDAVAGVFTFQGEPYFVSARAFKVREDGTGRRCVVLAKRVGESLVIDASRRLQVPLRVWANGDPAVSEEDASRFARLWDGRIAVHEARNDLFQAFTVMPDIRGQPGLLLRSDLPLTVLPQAMDTINTGNLIMVLSGIAVLYAAVAVTRRHVLRPLTRLTDQVSQIEGVQDLAQRVALRSRDEIGLLACAFDRMLARLNSDSAEKRRAEEALRLSEERYALAVAATNEGIWDWGLATDEVHYSGRWKAMAGLRYKDGAESPSVWWDRIHEDDRAAAWTALVDHLRLRSEHFQAEYRLRHERGHYVWVECRGLAVRDESGVPKRIVGSQTDITAQRTAEQQLTQEALFDSLTSLPNRTLFLERLDHCIRRHARDPEQEFAVLFLDLDGFKVINDSLGHVVGDELLRAIAEKLQSSIRAYDTVARPAGTVARLGGDEFVVLLEDLPSIHTAIRVAERIHQLLSEPFELGEHEIFTSASIGIASSSTGYTRPGDFLRSADTAMYRAKARGKSCHEIFDEKMHAQAMERLRMETDLRRASEREEFDVRYQAIVELESMRVKGFEALVRWNHPTKGTLQPDAFMEMAEEMGIVNYFGRQVLRMACTDLKAWQGQYPNGRALEMSVNLSARQFAEGDLVETVQAVLNETGLPAESLNLELTETAIIDNVDNVVSTLRKLDAINVGLSLDDFGTGYSSLSYLSRLPMHVVKIDRSFIAKMLVSPEHMQLVKTVVLLARNFGMETVAEGVETAEQLEALRTMGCACAQGYYFSKALSREQVADLLSNPPKWE